VHRLRALVAREREGNGHDGGVTVDGDARDHAEVDHRKPQLGLLHAVQGGTDFGRTDHSCRLSLEEGGYLHYRDR
jgi:hypothetical protein